MVDNIGAWLDNFWQEKHFFLSIVLHSMLCFPQPWRTINHCILHLQFKFQGLKVKKWCQEKSTKAWNTNPLWAWQITDGGNPVKPAVNLKMDLWHYD